MNAIRSLAIKGIGMYLPEKEIRNTELEASLALPDGWISKYIGVEKRHRVVDETNSLLGLRALNGALQDAQISADQIDLLIAASATFDYVIPNRSALLKHALNLSSDADFPCVDINTVCASFITALEYAEFALSNTKIRYVAIVSSEISSKGIDPGDPETYSLFGDGAAAVIVSRSEQGGGIIAADQRTYSDTCYDTFIKGGGNAYHPRDFAYDPKLYSFQMKGRSLLKEVRSKAEIFLTALLKDANVTLPNIDLIVPHQTSKMGLKLLDELNQGRQDNIANYLADYGNCIAASIPLALCRSIEEGRLKNGDTVMFLGTSAGMSISGLILKFNRS